MRIAIYAGIYKQNQDGATRSLYELVNSLLEKQIEVGIWGFSITPQERSGLTLNEIPSIPVGGYPDYRLTLINPKTDRQIRDFNPDIIHVAVPDFMGLHLVHLAKSRNIPIVMSFHTDFPSYLKFMGMGSLYGISWRILKNFYNQGNAVFVPTDEYMNKLRIEGIRGVRLWSRGIHQEYFNPSFRSEELRNRWNADGKKVILYCGRLVWHKNPDIVIRVYERFLSEQPGRARFVLCGDGPIRQELQERMPEAVFTGHQQGSELSGIYASSDIILFPSTTETFGNVILEGLSSGIPAVVSDVGGCSEIIRKSGGGIITPAGNSDQFYENCLRLIDDAGYYETLRKKGLEYAACQSWNLINQEMISQYYRLVEPVQQ